MFAGKVLVLKALELKSRLLRAVRPLKISSGKSLSPLDAKLSVSRSVRSAKILGGNVLKALELRSRLLRAVRLLKIFSGKSLSPLDAKLSVCNAEVIKITGL